MMRDFIFVSGLPRSGSTLLSALLNQNPKLTAGISSPTASLTQIVKVTMSQNSEISTQLDDNTRAAVLKGIFHALYEHVPEGVTVVDTSRAWSARIAELNALFGLDQVKLICLVRDPAWIFDSVERIISRNPLQQSRLVAPGSSLSGRMEAISSNNGLIGGPLAHLTSAVFGPYSRQVLLVEYDALCSHPKQALAEIYEFLELDSFEHDFDNFAFQQKSFDTALATPDLHTVSGPVEVIPRRTILPPAVFAALSARAFWREEIDTQATILSLQK
jgi:sulfotransferase